MKNIYERQKDILSIIRGLDISPTLYNEAVKKYQELGNFLNNNGLEAEIYPQGSFAFGTVVRPSAKDSSASYDLDFICQVTGSRDNHTPRGLRNNVESILKSSKTYVDRLKIDDTCFTIEYADVGEIGFSIDIVPAVDESNIIKQRLILNSPTPDLIDTSIAIPKYNSECEFQWITNNPKGLRKWFDEINAPFLASSKKNERMRIFTESRALFASIEEIPNELERSVLQRVIQILKCHRNNYYASLKDGNKIKPISAIITVAVSKIAQNCNSNCSVFELLNHVLSELTIYGEYQYLAESGFKQRHGIRSVFSRPAGIWYIENPANPEDNLADQWNVDDQIPNKFFQWIEIAQKDLISSLEQKDNKQFRAILESSFGSASVSRFLGEKYCGDVAPRQIVSQTAARPYGA